MSEEQEQKHKIFKGLAGNQIIEYLVNSKEYNEADYVDWAHSNNFFHRFAEIDNSVRTKYHYTIKYPFRYFSEMRYAIGLPKNKTPVRNFDSELFDKTILVYMASPANLSYVKELRIYTNMIKYYITRYLKPKVEKMYRDYSYIMLFPKSKETELRIHESFCYFGEVLHLPPLIEEDAIMLKLKYSELIEKRTLDPNIKVTYTDEGRVI